MWRQPLAGFGYRSIDRPEQCGVEEEEEERKEGGGSMQRGWCLYTGLSSFFFLSGSFQPLVSFLFFFSSVSRRARSAGGGAADSAGWLMLSRDHHQRHSCFGPRDLGSIVVDRSSGTRGWDQK
jgi:hypothetical protein